MTTAVESYLETIARELADLPEAERNELLEDLAEHFSEFGGDDELVAALGDPIAYARELREAAGLARPLAPAAHVTMIDRLRANRDAIRQSTWSRAVAAFLPELRPAWWVLRAWLVVAAFAGGIDFPFPEVADNGFVGLLALIIAIPLSVKLGIMARDGRRRGINTALSILGALFVIVLPASANDEGRDHVITEPSMTVPRPTIFTPGYPTTTVAASRTNVLAFEESGASYEVQIIGTNGPRAIALCPNELIDGPPRALRTVRGDAVECIGRLVVPTTTVPSTTSAPSTTTLPSTTSVPSTTSETSTTSR
jgi:hypothetical protein